MSTQGYCLQVFLEAADENEKRGESYRQSEV